jgi:branched-chain amino acid transport system ATP-binding protein
MLRIKNLNAGYGKSQILFDVSLEVKKKSMCAILGPNGSGKSTLLKSIFGLTNIYGGSIKYGERELVGLKPHQIASIGVVYVPQLSNIYTNLTVKDNLIMAGYVMPNEELDLRIEKCLEFFPDLRKLLKRKASMLSGGERQMLAMARAIVRQPQLILLDEPSSNLAPKITNKIFAKIKELNDSGITVVIVEQNVKKALEISQEAYLLASGRVNFFGSSEELIRNKELGRLFLGL